MINDEEYRKLMAQYPECEEPLRLQMDWENEQAFQKLISLKNRIPEALYGRILTSMYITDTEEVDIETLKRSFEGISREALMYDEDLEKYKTMPETITIYRGTQNPSERMPRLSWSLKRKWYTILDHHISSKHRCLRILLLRIILKAGMRKRYLLL